MGSCVTCDQYKSGVCPIGNPYRTMDTCIFKSETKAEDKMVDYLKSSKRVQAICDDWKNGLSLKEIAKKYEKSESYVRHLLNKEGVREPLYKIKAYDTLDTNLEKALLKDLKSNSYKIEDLISKYGVTRYFISQFKKNHNLVKKYKRKNDTSSKKEKKVESVEEKKAESVEEKEKDVVPGILTLTPEGITFNPNPVTFFYISNTQKPFSKCYPSARDDQLCWAIDIHNMEEFVQLIDEVKNVGSLVIDGNLIDVVLHFRLGDKEPQGVDANDNQ